MINLLPLRLIIIPTYERDSDNITPQLLLKYWHFKNNFIPSLILFKIEKIKRFNYHIYLNFTTKLNKNFIIVKM